MVPFSLFDVFYSITSFLELSSQTKIIFIFFFSLQRWFFFSLHILFFSSKFLRKKWKAVFWESFCCSFSQSTFSSLCSIENCGEKSDTRLVIDASSKSAKREVPLFDYSGWQKDGPLRPMVSCVAGAKSDRKCDLKGDFKARHMDGHWVRFS